MFWIFCGCCPVAEYIKLKSILPALLGYWKFLYRKLMLLNLLGQKILFVLLKLNCIEECIEFFFISWLSMFAITKRGRVFTLDLKITIFALFPWYMWLYPFRSSLGCWMLHISLLYISYYLTLLCQNFLNSCS
jgi:hypothetical protein